MSNNPQTATDKLLSPSMMHRLSDTEETRKPIPFEDRQQAMKEIGHAAAHDLVLPGEQATLRFSDGTERDMTVTGYSKSLVSVDIPSADGSTQPSNIDLGAFENLTRETRNQPPTQQ